VVVINENDLVSLNCYLSQLFKQMAFKRKYASRKPKRAYRKKSSRRSSVGSKSFTKKVKKVLIRSAETKTISAATNFNLAPYNGSTPWLDINVGLNTTNMIPSQGTGQGDRVGNRIRTKRCILTGYLHPYGYDAVNNPTPKPLEVKLVILTNKQTPQGYPNVNNYFQRGNTSSGPSGTLNDIVSAPNKDVNTIYHQKVMKLGHASESGSGSSTVQAFQANNDFRLNCKFRVDITKFLPKTYTFNDTTAGFMERNVFMRFLLANADGSTSASLAAATVWYQVDYKYTDF